MKKFFTVTLLTLLFLPVFLLAQEIDPISLPDAFAQAMAILTSGKLAGLGLVAAIAQVVMLALRTKLGEYAGKWRLTTFLAVSLALGVVGLMIGGLTFWPALMHSSTLAAFQVLAHQIYKQFVEKKD